VQIKPVEWAGIVAPAMQERHLLLCRIERRPPRLDMDTVVFKEIGHDDELEVHSIGQHGELLPGGIERTEDVSPGLMFIE
jgi:hypothetical protein